MLDPTTFETTVLPHYFGSVTFVEFVALLTNHGFILTVSSEWVIGDAAQWFCHWNSLFQRGHRNMVQQIEYASDSESEDDSSVQDDRTFSDAVGPQQRIAQLERQISLLRVQLAAVAALSKRASTVVFQ